MSRVCRRGACDLGASSSGVGHLQRLMREPLHPKRNSATCVNLLKLPEYTSPENLRQKLLCAYSPSVRSFSSESELTREPPICRRDQLGRRFRSVLAEVSSSSACNASRLPGDDSLRVPQLLRTLEPRGPCRVGDQGARPSFRLVGAELNRRTMS